MLKKSLPTKSFLLLVCFFITILPNQSSAQGSQSSSFKAQLMNIEAASNEVFRYQAALHNASSAAKTYEFNAELPQGWLITYRVNGSQVRSVQLDGGKVQDVQIEINASQSAEPKKYTVPIKAQSPADTLHLTLEAVVKGSYALQFTTPTGRVSEEVVSGNNETIQLIVKNTGTLPLNGLTISSQLPTKWEATFEPSTIEQLEAGKSADITATLKVPEKTIAGDYVANFTAKSPNDQREISFRILVKTSVLSGWIGILLILAAIGLVYFLIRKYGRR